jgi:hypothetical protein
MRRFLRSLVTVSVVGGVAGFLAVPSASAQQSVDFFLGGFVPTALDARGNFSGGVSSDVLVRDLDFFSFRFDRFTGPTFGGEYLIGLGDFFDAGASVGFYQQTVPAVDRNYTNSATGANIPADFKLRVVPFTATFRVLPLGHRAPVVPYFGAGIGVYGWRYSESGTFVDYTPPVPRNPPTFNGTFVGSGSASGPVVLGGIRIPIGPMAPGFEVRWQKGQANLPGPPEFEPGRTIDLGGLNYLFTFAIRF